MSKVDAQRAMREARYARNNPDGPVRGRGGAAAPTDPPTAAPATRRPSARTPSAATADAVTPASAAPDGVSSESATPDAATASSGLCGHKSMNGRACTREAGHAQKSHRYG